MSVLELTPTGQNGGAVPTLDLNANYYLYRERYSAFQQEIDWDAYFNSYQFNEPTTASNKNNVATEDLPSFEANLVEREDLSRHLEAQLGFTLSIDNHYRPWTNTFWRDEQDDIATGRTCRLCDTPLRHTFVDLGMSPLCESYVPAIATRFDVGRTYHDECAASPWRCGAWSAGYSSSFGGFPS